MPKGYKNPLVLHLKPQFCVIFVGEVEYSSVLKEAKEAVESEPQREDILGTPGTGFGELCEVDYIPTVSAPLNTSKNFQSPVFYMDY